MGGRQGAVLGVLGFGGPSGDGPLRLSGLLEDSGLSGSSGSSYASYASDDVPASFPSSSDLYDNLFDPPRQPPALLRFYDSLPHSCSLYDFPADPYSSYSFPDLPAALLLLLRLPLQLPRRLLLLPSLPMTLPTSLPPPVCI